jgi:hypothetical protein
MFRDIALVWGESLNPSPPAEPPGISFSLWSAVLRKPWLKWRPGEMPDLSAYKVFLINLFQTGDSTHAEQIRAQYPGAYIIISPDPSLDLVLMHTDWMNMYRQMAAADLIACRTHAECDFYGKLLNKPTAYLASPIGPENWFEPLRELDKDDYVLSLDHAFAPPNTVWNVSVLAMLQHETGCRILYATERDWTRQYAEFAGLKAEFLGQVSFQAFAEMTARAKVVVDMYASHAIGRQAILSAMVGTPVISSDWCGDAPGIQVKPYQIKPALTMYNHLLENEKFYSSVVSGQYRRLEYFLFDTCRRRFENILSQIEVPHCK